MKSPLVYCLIVFLAICCSFSDAQPLNSIKEFGAVQYGNCIRVSWKSASESGVDHYAVYRSTESTGPYSDCIYDNVRCKGDNQNYSIDDTRDLFKIQGRLFYYKVKSINASGSIVAETEAIATSYNSTSSTAKRTWGSIKAMFR